MKISILLPYKENYSKNYAGAVSIFINEVNKISKFKSSTKIYGNTDFKNYLSPNYINIPFRKKYFQSSSKIYVNNFEKIYHTIISIFDLILIHLKELEPHQRVKEHAIISQEVDLDERI